MPRGGRRDGRQYGQYPERSDLRTPKQRPPVAIPGQQYGQQAAQLRSQQAVPTGQAPQPQPVTPTTGPTASPGPPAATTPLIPLDAPTQRPNEPLTAGVDIGAGPGVPPMSRPQTDPAIEELRAIYLAHPNEDLRELLEDYDVGRDF